MATENLNTTPFVIEERVINGKKVKVKVFPSQADKEIKAWRERTEAGPTDYSGKYNKSK